MSMNLGTTLNVQQGDMVVVHPVSSFANFHVTVPSNDFVNLEHQIMTALDSNDPLIGDPTWPTQILCMVSWFIWSDDRDLTLEIQVDDTGAASGSMRFWRNFLLKQDSPNIMDGLCVPGVNSFFILRNSSVTSSGVCKGTIRLRAL